MLSGVQAPPAFPLRSSSGVNAILLLLGNIDAKGFYVEFVDKTRVPMRTVYKVGGVLGFFGGFLLAYQRSTSTCIPISSRPGAQIMNQNASGAGVKTSARKNATLPSSLDVRGRASLSM